jgi:hypothetical protein
LRNDNTIRHEKKLYRIFTRKKLKHAVVEERLDGKLYITDQGKILKYQELKEAPKQTQVKKKTLKRIKPVIPGINHPWRKPENLAKKAIHFELAA